MKSGEIMEHKHHAKSSLKFMSSEEILDELNLKGNEVFMDAGCGDGHIAIKAVEDYIPDGVVYAIDNYEPSIEEINAYKQENNLENLNIEGKRQWRSRRTAVRPARSSPRASVRRSARATRSTSTTSRR